ncbi:protein phosphatase 1 regulatory subunit 3A isoform X1 [Xyrichtys novacula]|uniref:Protein phosphatase 1 regulatory subunit 3A isoform X1 n=1 Tax=Xyrichtys novacula TaxID=13765 RepID=A0AAV1HFK5_XYRNO|nr:protein phosphatase 1 regulatory subunit 3A isoform X1 [Xyrichtys novacula]
MSFLSIPSQKGLFTTIKTGRSAEEAESRSREDNGDNNDDEDDEDDDTGNVHLIPRCSPVPRKRGASIYDETAEYMRIHQTLAAGKRVSFADTTGGDLVDVKEFVAFESDDEEESARWEEEESKYRKPGKEPTYAVQPEFHAPTDSALLQAVRTNKVEVEQLSQVEDEPLAFSGLVRVLNVSFHKAVYIRSTMDSWASYFDHPAEYVQGSHDGDTDKFSFKLSFAPPYITHGSRIEFVVRYETSEGDFWANNSHMNYVVTLLLSYEEDSVLTSRDTQHVKGILKPPKPYSMDDYEDDDDVFEETGDEEEKKEAQKAGPSMTGLVRPTAICPVIIQPEIDVEIGVRSSGPSVPSSQELPSVDGSLSPRTVSPGEQFPCTSPETALPAISSFVPYASESAQPYKSQPLPSLHCELGEQVSEPQSSPSALQQESGPSLDGRQSDEEEAPPSEASCVHLPTSETNLSPTTGEDRSNDSSESLPSLKLLPECVSGFEKEVAEGSSEFTAGLSDGSSRSAMHHEVSTPALFSPEVETEASLEAEGGASTPPELTETPSVSTGVTEVSQNSALQPVSAYEEKEDTTQISPDTTLEDPPNTQPEVSELQTELDINTTLMPSIVFISVVVSLLIVLQEPGALLVIGLFLVLYRL